MGQEITVSQFDQRNFEDFYQKLKLETRLLGQLVKNNGCSSKSPVAGFEVEAWLLDQQMLPAPLNESYLEALNDPMASQELAKFNIELNNNPVALSGDAFSRLYQQLEQTWVNACVQAENMDLHLLMIGTLPTMQQDSLNLNNMSDMNRYRALNEQILRARGKPIHLDITGNEHLRFDHHDVMLESATTSFQIHTQIPLAIAHHYYNASIIASAAVIAISANAPYLFGKDLWAESRIPLFEQAIETGGYAGAAHGPIRRVSFGSDYARLSIMECFTENLEHFPVLLPTAFDAPADEFSHLRLHNGTIWRWNRPLLGFDDNGTPHIRVEHRIPPAGPTIIDSIANAAFYYGLATNLSADIANNGLPFPFAQAKDNFYQAARFGLKTQITWYDNHKHHINELIENELLTRAESGLQSLGIDQNDIDGFLGIIHQRNANKQNGSNWQRQFIKHNNTDFKAMTRQYLDNQKTGNPVAEWGLD